MREILGFWTSLNSGAWRLEGSLFVCLFVFSGKGSDEFLCKVSFVVMALVSWDLCFCYCFVFVNSNVLGFVGDVF